MVAFGFGAGAGAVLGFAWNLLFPSLRSTRKDAAVETFLAGAVGAAVTLLPLGKSKVVDAAAMAGGVLAASSAVDIAFPYKKPRMKAAK